MQKFRALKGPPQAHPGLTHLSLCNEYSIRAHICKHKPCNIYSICLSKHILVEIFHLFITKKQRLTHNLIIENTDILPFLYLLFLSFLGGEHIQTRFMERGCDKFDLSTRKKFSTHLRLYSHIYFRCSLFCLVFGRDVPQCEKKNTYLLLTTPSNQPFFSAPLLGCFDRVKAC